MASNDWELRRIVREWENEKDNLSNQLNHEGLDSYTDLLDYIVYLSEQLYSSYLPAARFKDKDFHIRLNEWILNSSDPAHRRGMLYLLRHVMFVGNEERISLYSTAFRENLISWLISLGRIDPLSSNINFELHRQLSHTTLCAGSDSMIISDFVHLNGLPDQSYRFDLRSLYKLGCIDKLASHIRHEKNELVVILEDFVGSGTQIGDCLEDLASNIPEVRMLVIPLIICPGGLKRLKKRFNPLPNVYISPVLELEQDSMIRSLDKVSKSVANLVSGIALPPGSFRKALFSSLVEELHAYTRLTKRSTHLESYGFGCGAQRSKSRSGALLVQAGNCPNNAPPILHFQSITWRPLFKRIQRS